MNEKQTHTDRKEILLKMNQLLPQERNATIWFINHLRDIELLLSGKPMGIPRLTCLLQTFYDEGALEAAAIISYKLHQEQAAKKTK